MRVGKHKNGKAAGRDEITGEMIKGGCGGYVIWLLRMMLCLKTRDLSRSKERERKVRIIEVLAC